MAERGMDLARILADNPLVLAPMAGWTDLAFRLLTKPYGAALVYTEMVSAEGLIRGDAKTWALIRSHPAEAPVVVQIFGPDPERMARAAALVAQSGVSALDLNMGCPVPKVVKQGAGSALMRDLDRAEDIMRRVKAAVDIPVLAKIRSGWSASKGVTAVELARRAEAVGLAGLAVHPRFARQGFTGRADWEVIGRVAEAVRMPVIGSGDVTEPAQAAEMLALGAAGVMIGRAAVGQPWFFSQARDALAGRERREVSLDERRATIKRHLALLVHYQGRRQAWLKFKGLSGAYLRGLPGARHIRRAVHVSADLDDMMELLDRYFDAVSEGETPK